MSNIKEVQSEQAMRVHELKTDPEVFRAVVNGLKTYEIRFNDRGFKVGDELLFRQTEFTGSQMHPGRQGLPLIYTGREARRTVSHILTGYGLQDGWCILSFAVLRSGEQAPAPVARPGLDDEWFCESHPDLPMGHDGCGGAGILGCARVERLAQLLRLAKQEVRETAMHRDDLVSQLLCAFRHLL